MTNKNGELFKVGDKVAWTSTSRDAFGEVATCRGIIADIREDGFAQVRRLPNKECVLVSLRKLRSL